MPNLIKQIPETMWKQGIPEEIISQFDFPKTNSSEDIMALIRQMDKLLTEKQCLSVMQEQGCSITGEPAKAHRDFYRKHKDKPLKERVALSLEVNSPHKYPCRLNDDGTLSVWWDGDGQLRCPCGMIKKLPEAVGIPLTFCGCCGGHARQNLQKSLGVDLRLIKIVSSVNGSGGKKRCEFLYKVLDPKLLCPDDIKDDLDDAGKAVTDEFIAFAEQYGLKPAVRYAGGHKTWKCVYTLKKPKRVIFTIETAPGKLNLKACLFNIEKYLHKYALADEIKSQLIGDRNWNCGNCSEKCRKGVPFSIDEQDYYKCIGGAFTLGPLGTSDWKQVRDLIKEELAVSLKGGTLE